MEASESTGIFFGILLIALFIVSFLAGDIAGIVIERNSAKKWRIAAGRIGFKFDGQKRRTHSLSEIFLPKLLFQDAQETAFSFCQITKSLNGKLHGLDISINDLTVWDYHTRGPMIYRSVVSIVKGHKVELSGPIAIVAIASVLAHGFERDKTLKEYTLFEEDAFSAVYRVFGHPGSSLSIISEELRRFFMEHTREIDCLMTNEEAMILVWTSDNPTYFPQLVNLSLDILSRLTTEGRGATA